MRDLAAAAEVPLTVLGEVRGHRLVITPYVDVELDRVRQAWANALPRRLAG